MTRIRLAWVIFITCLEACSFQRMVQPAADGSTGSGSDSGSGGGITDSDGDGVPDDIDNCVSIPNADQHDEDGDKVGDVCDPCPQVANATTDSDGDGIPDACDPRPDKSGDMLVKFEPFTGSGNLPQGWLSKGGGQPTDWLRGNDTLTIAADNNTRIAIFDTGSPHHAIDIGVNVLSASGSGLQFLTGLTDSKNDIRQFLGCGMRFDNQQGGRSRELFAYDFEADPQFTNLALDTNEQPMPSGAYRIQFVMEGRNETCVIPNGINLHRQSASEDSRGNSFVGLRANNVTVAFRYVAIYRF